MIVTVYTSNTMRGSKSFLNGKRYQTSVFAKCCQLVFQEQRCSAIEVEGAKPGTDVTLSYGSVSHGIETKVSGAFEGGGVKVYFEGGRYIIHGECIHKYILGDTSLYGNIALPWYQGKRTEHDWEQVKDQFPDFYIHAPSTAVSEYYKTAGSSYIQIENHGLYHTGEDPMQLGVPFFDCPTRLRIRVSKHKKKGIPTDVTAALVYTKPPKSPFSLDGTLPLPSALQVVADSGNI